MRDCEGQQELDVAQHDGRKVYTSVKRGEQASGTNSLKSKLQFWLLGPACLSYLAIPCGLTLPKVWAVPPHHDAAWM